MAKQSEGVRRIFFLMSIVAVIGWIVFVWIIAKPFSEWSGDIWAIAIGAAIVAFFVPQLIRVAAYWIKDGFEKDSARKAAQGREDSENK